MKNIIIAILVAVILVLGFLFFTQKKSNISYEPWPETEPATVRPTTTNNPAQTNPTTPTQQTQTQTQTTTTFSKDGTPLVFQYPSRFGNLDSVMDIYDGYRAIYVGYFESSFHVTIKSTGYPGESEIDVRDNAKYNQLKNFYDSTEYTDASGNIYFIANGKPPCDGPGIICSPTQKIGVKKLPANNYGFGYALVIGSANITLEEFKNVVSSINILNLPPAPGTEV